MSHYLHTSVSAAWIWRATDFNCLNQNFSFSLTQVIYTHNLKTQNSSVKLYWKSSIPSGARPVSNSQKQILEITLTILFGIYLCVSEFHGFRHSLLTCPKQSGWLLPSSSHSPSSLSLQVLLWAWLWRRMQAPFCWHILFLPQSWTLSSSSSSSSFCFDNFIEL